MAKTFTTKQLQAGFNCGHMTIYNWRQGTATKSPLPCEVNYQGRVRFPAAQVISWAKKHEVAFDVKQAELGERPAKPGPKPKTNVAAKKATPAKKVAPAKKAARQFKQKSAAKKATPRKSNVTPLPVATPSAEATAAAA